eukprot:7277667-Alexandrium_andersonii.AAC.1
MPSCNGKRQSMACLLAASVAPTDRNAPSCDSLRQPATTCRPHCTRMGHMGATLGRDQEDNARQRAPGAS